MSRIANTNQTKARTSDAIRVLRVDASSRYEDSVSRVLTDTFISEFGNRHGNVDVTTRDVAQGLPFVDEAWITANLTPPDERTPAHRSSLAQSDALVEELANSDVVVIGVPVYNFGIPATLKAWIDMVARARLTFRYTETGPEGLLRGKKAYLIVTSGGTAVGSDIDFATGYMRHVLGFLGIREVDVISADQLMMQGERALESGRAQAVAAAEALSRAREERAA
jgi:FMN-dependent NADH-azoreductase